MLNGFVETLQKPCMCFQQARETTEYHILDAEWPANENTVPAKHAVNQASTS